MMSRDSDFDVVTGPPPAPRPTVPAPDRGKPGEPQAPAFKDEGAGIGHGTTPSHRP
jgi:hypothetical protein